MRGKTVFIIMVFILLATISYCGCSKEKETVFKEGKTQEEIIAEEIKGKLEILNSALDIDIENPPDDEGYRTLIAIVEMVEQGDTLEELKGKMIGILIEGPFPDINLAEMPDEPPYTRFKELVKDVPPGGFSKVQQIEGHGFGVLYIVNTTEGGIIEMGVIIVPIGTPVTMKEATPETVSGDTETTTSSASGG